MTVNHVEIKVDDKVLYVRGDLDFNNVMSLYDQSLKIISAATQPVTIDLSGLRSTNSAALAVIVGWMRLGKKTGKKINFRHVSADILSLAKASGLNKIIDPVIV